MEGPTSSWGSRNRITCLTLQEHDDDDDDDENLWNSEFDKTCLRCSTNDSHIIIACTRYTGLFEMIVGVLTTCHTQYTWDRSIRSFLFNRTTLQVFVTYLIGALNVHPLWFYKHQHDNRVRSKLFVACQRWWFQWRFWFVPWRNPIERNHMGLHLENEVARRVASDHPDNHFE